MGQIPKHKILAKLSMVTKKEDEVNHSRRPPKT